MIRVSLRLSSWRGPAIIARTTRITAAYGPVLGQQLRQEIQTSQFPWPRETKRRNRSTVFSPRDIVDLGRLLNSQRLETSPNRLRFIWDPVADNGFAYAPLVFTGYITSAGTIVPGRDWMRPALNNQPLTRFFTEQWRTLAR